MAKNYVDVTYDCGHTGTVMIDCRSKDLEWRISRLDLSLCPECEEKRKEEEYKEAVAFNKENGFCGLSGSEKQIRWAEVIRKQLFNQIDKYAKENDKPEVFIIAEDEINKLKKQTNAGKIIDMRNKYMPDVIIWRIMEKDFPIEETSIIAEPNNKTHDEVAKVYIDKDGNVCATYKKNQDFIDLVKSVRMRWSSNSSMWYKRNLCTMISKTDSAAHLGNLLLTNGFVVEFNDEIIMDMAVNGDFKPDKVSWIDTTRSDKFVIHTNDEGVSKAAAKLFESGYYDNTYLARQGKWEAVLEFKEMYDLGITDHAQELIDTELAKTKRTVDPVLVAMDSQEDKLSAVLNSSRDIIDDLRD